MLEPYAAIDQTLCSNEFMTTQPGRNRVPTGTVSAAHGATLGYHTGAHARAQTITVVPRFST
jgi:hypothetical protein